MLVEPVVLPPTLVVPVPIDPVVPLLMVPVVPVPIVPVVPVPMVPVPIVPVVSVPIVPVVPIVDDGVEVEPVVDALPCDERPRLRERLVEPVVVWPVPVVLLIEPVELL